MKSIVLCDSDNPEKVLPLCDKYNLGIEIQGFYDPNKTDNKNEIISYYKSILPQNIERHLHAPFWDLCMGSGNMKIAKVTRHYFDYAYCVAEELKCKSITVHHGYVPNTSNPSTWIKRSAYFWHEFFNAHSGDIEIHMENLSEYDTEIISGVMDACSNDRLSVNLDIGHAHFNSKLPVLDWIKTLNKRIRYVHLHQNNGISDEHLGFRKGNIPINEVLNKLNEYAPEAVWALECNLDDMQDSVSFLIEHGYITV